MLDNPIKAYLLAAREREQNRNDMNQDIAGIGKGLGQGMQSIGQSIQQQRQKKTLQQLVQAMNTQGNPQQGPQLPQGPSTGGMTQPPTSGMGGPSQDNTNQIRSLMMQLDPQAMIHGMAGKMFPTPMNPLQQSQIAKNNALTARLAQPSQPKQTNPLDDAIKMKRMELMDLMEKKIKAGPSPKVPNPVPGAALDMRAQIANNAQAPWYKKMGFAGGLKPVVNPLSGKKVQGPTSDVSGMSDEELMAIVNGGDQ